MARAQRGAITLTFPARVNGATLGQHKGQNVRLTAKVIEISNDRATVEASDGVKVS